jgi:hypothetical protein
MIPRTLRLRFAAAALALPIALASCQGNGTGPSEQDERELASAKAAWSAQPLHSYTMVVRPACYCGPESIRMTVVNGALTSKVFVETGMPVPAALFHQLETVDAMLATLEKALGQDVPEFRATYDARGVPLTAYIDWSANAIDEEFGWGVIEITPLP